MKRLLLVFVCLGLFAAFVDAGSRSYGGGGGSRSAPSSSAGRSYSGGSSGRSYGGRSSTTRSTPSTSKPSVPSSSGRSYGGGSSTTTSKPVYTPPKTGITSHGYDSKGGAVQKQVESTKIMQGSVSKPTYTTSTGKEQPVYSSSATKIRTSLNSQTYAERPTRHYNFYSTYYSRPAPFVYSDPFNGFFYLWMLDQSLDRQAMWIHHHQSEIDKARLAEMYTKNAALQAKVNALTKEKVDPTYVPDGVEPDLMYSDEYVNAAFNPEVAEDGSSGWWVVLWVVLILGVLFVVFFVIEFGGRKL